MILRVRLFPAVPLCPPESGGGRRQKTRGHPLRVRLYIRGLDACHDGLVGVRRRFTGEVESKAPKRLVKGMDLWPYVKITASSVSDYYCVFSPRTACDVVGVFLLGAGWMQTDCACRKGGRARLDT